MQEMMPHVLLVAKLSIFMGVGVLARRRGVIPDGGKQLLTDLIIRLVLPCSIVSSFLTELTMDRLRQSGEIFLIGIGIQLVSFLLAHVAFRRCAGPHQAVMQYATVCSNSGILGTPIAEGIFGPEGTLLAAIYLIPLRILMWTLGLTFFTRESGKLSLKKIVTHPCIAAVLVGMLLMATQWSLPPLAETCLREIGRCNTPLSMILVGSIIADMNLRLLFHRDTLYYSVIRLAALPLLVAAACRWLGVAPLVRNVSVILTAMPAGSTTSILALKYNCDADFACACTTLTTVLSLLSVPVWCGILL